MAGLHWLVTCTSGSTDTRVVKRSGWEYADYRRKLTQIYAASVSALRPIG
jgi:hypothetical protein